MAYEESSQGPDNSIALTTTDRHLPGHRGFSDSTAISPFPRYSPAAEATCPLLNRTDRAAMATVGAEIRYDQVDDNNTRGMVYSPSASLCFLRDSSLRSSAVRFPPRLAAFMNCSTPKGSDVPSKDMTTSFSNWTGPSLASLDSAPSNPRVALPRANRSLSISARIPASLPPP
jgi:hypothetical protein